MSFLDLQNLTVPNIVFVIVLAIGGSYLTFLTAKGGLTNNTYRRRWWKRITKRGRIVLCLSLFMLITLVLQECNTQRVNNQKDDLLTKERNGANNKIATGIERGVDSSNRKLFSDLSKAFAKQNLQFDTLKKTVERIKDSVKTVINNTSQPDPVIFIDSNAITIDGRKGDISHFRVVFKSVDAGSTNFHIYAYHLSKRKTGIIKYEGKGEFLSATTRIPTGAGGAWGFSDTSVENLQDVYLFLHGTYTSLDGKKRYNLDEFYDYNLENKKVYELIESSKNNFLLLIPKSEL